MVKFYELDAEELREIQAQQETTEREVGDRPFQHDRVPFWLTCPKWQDRGSGTGSRAIVLFCNPSEVDIEFSWRESEQEVKGGMVRHSWRNRKGNTYVKEVKLGFTFQTGNTMPYLDENGDIQVAQGLRNLYDTLELLDEERIWKGRANYVQIGFNSSTFPRIVLTGFFDPDEFSIPQSAEELHGFSFQLNFTARKIYPDMTQARQLVEAFKDSGAFRIKSTETALGTVAGATGQTLGTTT